MEGVGPKTTAYGTLQAQPPLDRAIAELATRQYGVVEIGQLKRLGLSPTAVRKRVSAGRLHRIFRGVYAVGRPTIDQQGRWMAAVLACGPGAVLSHRSAGAHLGLRPSTRLIVDVTSDGRAGRSREGIDAHRGDTLHPIDIDVVDGIRCTTVARTLLDLAEVVSRRELERACDQAEVLRVFDLRAVEDVLTRAGGRHSAPALEAIFAEYRFGATLTRSEMEERFLAICDAAGIPRPEVNVWLPLPGGGGVTADFVWRRYGLVVETDGLRYHATRDRFERDRRRDQALMLAGWRVVRFTWRQVFHEADQVAATVVVLLEQAGRRPA